MSRDAATRVLKAFWLTVFDAVSLGDEVHLPPFGKFFPAITMSGKEVESVDLAFSSYPKIREKLLSKVKEFLQKVR